MKQQLLFITSVFLVCISQFTNAQNTSNAYLVRSTIGVSGSSESITVNNKQYIVQQSIGQLSVIGTFKNSAYTFRQGFIQPPILSAKIRIEETNIQALIYPNPFEKSITISFKEPVKEPLLIYVYDMLGRVIYNGEREATQKTTINLNYLSSGLYVIHIKTGEKKFKANLIKQ
jgi:hypothetical protein